MLYYLSLLKSWWSPLNVFHYTTFRMGGAFLTALMACLVLGPPFIRWLKHYGIGQTVRPDGPRTHLVKSGTPTMGGMILFLAMIGAALLWARLDNRLVLGVLGCAVYLWVLGFSDDYLKWVKKHPGGVPSDWKLFWQVLLGLAIATWLYLEPVHPTYGTAVMVPYLKDTFLALGRWYIPFSLLVLVGSSNAVNLTDGLDGLA
ncbi:MAG: phospho-N-acetylmuramoyl-pentapeptide-transferase, partial [Elusimicrobia bacterium]|nr:phospho-N-acetylmuramoyl-pentapeptide-transferase [Elusimicrobiota bacterium]